MSQGRFYHAHAAAARGETAHRGTEIYKMQGIVQNHCVWQNVRGERTVLTKIAQIIEKFNETVRLSRLFNANFALGFCEKGYGNGIEAAVLH